MFISDIDILNKYYLVMTYNIYFFWRIRISKQKIIIIFFTISYYCEKKKFTSLSRLR